MHIVSLWQHITMKTITKMLKITEHWKLYLMLRTVSVSVGLKPNVAARSLSYKLDQSSVCGSEATTTVLLCEQTLFNLLHDYSIKLEEFIISTQIHINDYHFVFNIHINSTAICFENSCSVL
jgi:hypothetical protein